MQSRNISQSFGDNLVVLHKSFCTTKCLENRLVRGSEAWNGVVIHCERGLHNYLAFFF